MQLFGQSGSALAVLHPGEFERSRTLLRTIMEFAGVKATWAPAPRAGALAPQSPIPDAAHRDFLARGSGNIAPR